MALARSASGPGGLSINTGTANSLFGSSTSNQTSTPGTMFGAGAGTSTSQTPGTGGMFGSSTMTTTAPPAPGLLSAPQPAPPSGGIFGGSLNTVSASQAGGGMFRSSTATATSQPQQSGGLFGSLNSTTQPQQSGGLFGGLNNSTQPQQSTGLFGNLGSQNAQNQAPSAGGIFGSNLTTQQPAQTGGLFAGLNNQTQNKPAGASLFGGLNTVQNQQPPPQQTGGLFSSLNRPAQAPSGNMFGNTIGGGLKLGQSQAPSVPGVRIDVSLMKGTTRFNDLHEDLQKQIEDIDKTIIAQQALSGDCEAIMPSHASQLSCIPTDVEFLSRKLLGVESSLENDAEAVSLIGQLVKSDAEHAKLSFKAIDNLKLPPQYHNQGNWIGSKSSSSVAKSSSRAQSDSSSPQDLVSYFSQTADEMTATLSRYQSHIGEIEQHLRTVEAATVMQAQQLSGPNGGGVGFGDDADEKKRELAAVLREFEAGIRGVAGVVAETREGMQRLHLGGFVSDPTSSARLNGNGKRMGIY